MKGAETYRSSHRFSPSPSSELRRSTEYGVQPSRSVAYLPTLKDRSNQMHSTKIRREFELSRIMKNSLMENSLKAETEKKYERLKL